MGLNNFPEASAYLRLEDEDVDRRKMFVNLQSEDLLHIAVIKDVVGAHANELADEFFEFLSTLPETSLLFQEYGQLDEVKRLKRAHILAMVAGKYDREYVEQRVRLGLIYGKAGVAVRAFLGAFCRLMTSIGSLIAEFFHDDPRETFTHFASLEKLAFFDIGIICDVLIETRERVIAIEHTVTPVLQVRDSLLILPIVGVIDSLRAKQLTDTLLRAIRENRAKVVIIDITGVAAVDSRVANHIIQTVAASRLMGARVIVTGLSADVAQSIVTLGIDLGALHTVGDLEGGLEEAERLLGYTMIRSSSSSIER